MNNNGLKYVSFAIIVSIAIVYLSRNISNTILLFPSWLNVLLYLIALPIAWYCVSRWQIFSSDKEENKNAETSFNGILAILIAFVLLSAFRLPINMFIKQQSKKNEISTQICPITFYSLSLKNQRSKRITFTLNNKSIKMKVRPSVMAKIKALQTPQKKIQLQLRKSILGTYVVEDYDVIY